MRIALYGLLLFAAPLFVTAQTPSGGQDIQKYVHYLEPGGLVLIETLEPGMTLYSLSRTYNVDIDSILQANPDLNPEAIPLGYPVNIPIYHKAISFLHPDAAIESIAISYRVQPKETLYRVSHVYLDAAPETIVSLNPGSEKGLAIGQVLRLGWYLPQSNTHSPQGADSQASENSNLYAVKDFTKEYKTEGQIIREQKGLAFWRPGNAASHYYVLHPTARVGSFMEVTNPMLHRTVTAKVAGNIPPGLYQSHVGLVVSPSVARALGVLDQQFFAEWRFVE